MNRQELLQWIQAHPGCARGDPERLLERCERVVRRHAAEDAWLCAKALIEAHRELFEGAWGSHASEAYVAGELCHELAEALRRREPVPQEGSQERLTGAALLAAFEPVAREQVRRWILELAREEEHRVWAEIVRFTDRRGRGLVREGRLSRDLSFRGTHSYAETASRVASMLAEECEAHAHPAIRRR